MLVEGDQQYKLDPTNNRCKCVFSTVYNIDFMALRILPVRRFSVNDHDLGGVADEHEQILFVALVCLCSDNLITILSTW